MDHSEQFRKSIEYELSHPEYMESAREIGPTTYLDQIITHPRAEPLHKRWLIENRKHCEEVIAKLIGYC